MRRLVEFHRLLISRKGSLSAAYKKNAEANDKAYDLNQKTIQALDSLAADYIAVEATMEMSQASTRQEMRYTQRPQRRLESSSGTRRIRKDDLDCSNDDLAAPTREFSDCWAAHEATVCNRRATHEAICVEARKALHRTYDTKRKASEKQESLATHTKPTRRISNEHARAEGHVKLAPWVEQYKQRPKPRTA